MNERQAWELATWDALETRERLSRREVSADEVVEAAVLRAGQAARLNAIVTPTWERARVDAKRLSAGPLAGVPSFTKDLSQVEGVRTTWGTAAAGHYVSKRSDPTVQLLERLGLVSLGKSATPEFGLTATTESLAFGPTRNPWDETRSTGGSSGGAAALVASGVVPLAHGSDGGGSVRLPASCCGLVGLKVSCGRLDMEGSTLLPVNIAVHGVLTRTVRDTVAFWKGVDALQPHPHLPRLDVVDPAPRRRLRISLVVKTPRGDAIDAEVQAALEATGKRLERLGHHVELAPCPFDKQDTDDFLALWMFIGIAHAKLGRLVVHSRFNARALEPWTHHLARKFAERPWDSTKRIRRLRAFTARWGVIMQSRDVVLMPTLGQLPPPIGYLASDLDFDEKLERLTQTVPFTGLINAAGAPAISLPLGRSAAGLPIGVQFAAAMGEERLLLELALQLEADSPWPRMKPLVTP